MPVFSPLTLDKTGTGYALTATATGLNPGTSGGFNITPGAATQLVFGAQPSTTVADHQISPAVQVTALDPAGNPVTSFTGSVTVALGNNLGGSTLSGTTTTAAVGGVATFVDLRLNKTGTGYTLTASASTFTAGVIWRFATVVLGCAPNTSWVAAPGVILKPPLVAWFRPAAVAVSA